MARFVPCTPSPPLFRQPLETDRPREKVELAQHSSLPGVQFWRVEGSDRHWSVLHDTYVACLVKGPAPLSAHWVSRGEKRAIGVGGVQLMEPGEAHRTTFVSEPASFFVVWWAPAVMAKAAAELGSRADVHFRAAQLDSPPVSRALGELATSLDSPDPASIEATFVSATERLIEHAAEPSPARAWRGHPSVRRALERLQDAPADTVSLDDLARETGLSKFHLARTFRETTGVPPHRYQQLLRLQAARRHLERGVSVEESAILTGFADGPHLTRTFRKWLGVSPGSWARASTRPGVPRFGARTFSARSFRDSPGGKK